MSADGRSNSVTEAVVYAVLWGGACKRSLTVIFRNIWPRSADSGIKCLFSYHVIL